jgi:type IV secretory pathway VirB10-like protein
MPVAAAPRFALEAGFLVLLAVVLGFADLDPLLIVVLMGLAWVLVSLIEYLAWRQGPRFPVRFARAAAPVEEEDAMPEPPPQPPPPAPEEQTAVAPAPEAPPAEGEEAPKAALQFEQEQRARHRLEPLEPRPRRRWVIFGPRERPGEKPGSRDEES